MAELGYGARVAVIGAGIGGLACARELRRWGLVPVVFEGAARVGGRCASIDTRCGTFDHAAQFIDAGFEHVSQVPQPRAGLSTLHAWSIGTAAADTDDDDDAAPSLHTIGLVGVPSMAAFAQAMARSIDVRLSTPIRGLRRQIDRWVLNDGIRDIDEHFAAVALALPAPLAAPLLESAPGLAAALGSVVYRPRWVLLLGALRQTGLPLYREYAGSPIERVAAIHTKPGRTAAGRSTSGHLGSGRSASGHHERWFVEADAHWSALHANIDDISVTELMLENLNELAGREIAPVYVSAHAWPQGVASGHAAAALADDCLWDEGARIGACGDSVVASRLDRVFDSGIALARRIVAEVHQSERSTRFGFSALGAMAPAANDGTGDAELQHDDGERCLRAG